MNMSFEEMVETLSNKYHKPHSRVYDLMTIAEVRLVFNEPFEYIFRYKAQREQAFKIIDKYFGIEKAHTKRLYDEARKEVKLINLEEM